MKINWKKLKCEFVKEFNKKELMTDDEIVNWFKEKIESEIKENETTNS